MKELTPKQIVKELDKYIIGQSKAKKAVAIAMRNRWRRQQVSGYMRDEIMPNNIIMIGVINHETHGKYIDHILVFANCVPKLLVLVPFYIIP